MNINSLIYLSSLTQGGFGIVYKGIPTTYELDGTQRKEVAIKEIKLNGDPLVFFEFQHELMIMGYRKT